MKPYQLSVSIVVYKSDPSDVISALTSIISTHLRVKCTVIDNSPTRALQKCVEEHGASYIYSGQNIGFGSAHNLALRTDSQVSEYHLVLNPDVHFAAEVPEALYRLMIDNEEIGLVMPRILYPDGTDQHLCKRLPSPFELFCRRFLGRTGRSFFYKQLDRYELHHLDLTIPREIPSLSGCFMFLRSKVICEVGLFDERFFLYMEDVDLCRRVGAKYKTVFYPNVSVTHGYVKGSYRNPKLLKYHLQSAFKYFCKWGWIFDQDRSRINRKTAPLITDRPETNCALASACSSE